jgi:Protein kinase domain
MGQDQSQPSLRLQRNERKRNSKQRSVEKPKELATLKNILIIANTQEITIEVTDDTLTCGWLLSETIRAYTGTGTIVALKTAKKLEILDYWLNIFDRSLQPLKDNEKLIAVFDQPVSSDVQINHFIPLKVIGEGGFSKVVMAAKKDTGLLYAIKVMSKEFVIKEEKISQIITEKNILTKCFHPFIVELHWAFQSVFFM